MTDSGNHPETVGSGEHVPFLLRFLATGFFSGYIPWASGTFGTLVGLLLYFIPGTENPAVLGAMIFVGLLAGVPAAAAVARGEGHRLTRSAEKAKALFQAGHHEVPDPSIVVIDEIVGIWVTLLLLPKTLLITACAFVTFRAMDILKPEPARWIERVPNGWGIMLDDVVAGLYANLIVQVVTAMLRVVTSHIV